MATFSEDAIEAATERIFASFIVNAKKRQPCSVLAEDVLRAAYPAIRRAIIEELAAKAEVKALWSPSFQALVAQWVRSERVVEVC